jgi:hypothetical protein
LGESIDRCHWPAPLFKTFLLLFKTYSMMECHSNGWGKRGEEELWHSGSSESQSQSWNDRNKTMSIRCKVRNRTNASLDLNSVDQTIKAPNQDGVIIENSKAHDFVCLSWFSQSKHQTNQLQKYGQYQKVSRKQIHLSRSQFLASQISNEPMRTLG